MGMGKGKYAEDTSVSVERSKGEIERILARYGAKSFMYGYDQIQAVIAFEIHDRRYQMKMPLPDKREFTITENGRRRTSQNSINEAWEQAVRQRWRAMALYIKAILEAVEVGILTLEDALLAKTFLPNGKTVGEWMAPQLDQVYQTGNMPPMLPGTSSYQKMAENLSPEEYRRLYENRWEPGDSTEGEVVDG